MNATTMGTERGFITIRVPFEGVHGMPLVFTLPTVHVEITPPKRPPLQGWKAIMDFSKDNNGPTSDDQLRRLAQAGQCPIHGFGEDGPVFAEEEEFLRWLKNRRVHLAFRPLSRRKAPKKGKKRARGDTKR